MPRRFRQKKFKSSQKKIFTRKCITRGKIITSHRIEKEPNPVILLGHLHPTPRQKVAHHTRLLSNMTQTAPYIVPQFSYGSMSLDKTRKLNITQLKQNRFESSTLSVCSGTPLDLTTVTPNEVATPGSAHASLQGQIHHANDYATSPSPYIHCPPSYPYGQYFFPPHFKPDQVMNYPHPPPRTPSSGEYNQNTAPVPLQMPNGKRNFKLASLDKALSGLKKRRRASRKSYIIMSTIFILIAHSYSDIIPKKISMPLHKMLLSQSQLYAVSRNS